MPLADWADLTEEEAAAVEADDSGWCVQEKKDGVRALLHVTTTGVRITGRSVSETTFRLSEFQENVPHLTAGFDDLTGTVLDGELVCPVAEVDTGDTTTASALQAGVAILAARPEKAKAIQDRHDARLRFHAFDVLRFRGEDLTSRPLADRLAALEVAYLSAANPHLELIPTHTRDKPLVHELLIADGKEGTVWKRLDSPYLPGKRVRHWLKRKRSLEVEAVVTGFKPGTADRGNAHLVGAVEFSVLSAGGPARPIAWVSSWPDEERRRMTWRDGGAVALSPEYLGRTAVIGGQDFAGKSSRLRHAKVVRWVGGAAGEPPLPAHPGDGGKEGGFGEQDRDGVGAQSGS
jgi:ATP-dependent DNA ligase